MTAHAHWGFGQHGTYGPRPALFEAMGRVAPEVFGKSLPSHEELGESWEVVAQYLGDKLTTVLNHYFRAGEDALRDSVGKLANL